MIVQAFSALNSITYNASFKTNLIYYNSIFINSLYCFGIAFRNRLNIMKLALGTGDVTFQIIKVDVTPPTRAVVDQSDLCLLAIKLYDIPGHSFHCLSAFTGHSLLHLKRGSKFIRNAMNTSPLRKTSRLAIVPTATSNVFGFP